MLNYQRVFQPFRGGKTQLPRWLTRASSGASGKATVNIMIKPYLVGCGTRLGKSTVFLGKRQTIRLFHGFCRARDSFFHRKILRALGQFFCGPAFHFRMTSTSLSDWWAHPRYHFHPPIQEEHSSRTRVHQPVCHLVSTFNILPANKIIETPLKITSQATKIDVTSKNRSSKPMRFQFLSPLYPHIPHEIHRNPEFRHKNHNPPQGLPMDRRALDHQFNGLIHQFEGRVPRHLVRHVLLRAGEVVGTVPYLEK